MDGNTGAPFSINFEIAKVDQSARQVWGYATVEQPDRQGDIVDYNASVDAFKAWPGNVREQHNKGKVAVGKCISWKAVPENRGIWVGAYISKSPDGEATWTKVQEGILKGFSIGGEALDTRPEVVKSDSGTRTLNRIIKYRLDELSLVDNPACPDAAICLVKSVDGVLEPTDVLRKVQVTTVGDAAMPVDGGTMSQRGTTPPSAGTVQSDTTTGEMDPNDDDTTNKDDQATAADANLTVDAPSMPTPDTAKPNGLMDQRGKPINAGGAAIKSADEVLGGLAGLSDADIAKAVRLHLEEQNASLTASASPSRTPAPVQKVADPAPATPAVDIHKVLGDFKASLLAEVKTLLKSGADGNPPPDHAGGKTDGDDRLDVRPRGTNDADGDGEDEPEDPDDKRKLPAGFSDAAPGGSLSAEDITNTIHKAVGSQLAATTGTLEKALGDLLAKSLGDFQKAVGDKLTAIDERVKRVESMPGYPDGTPAVRAIDKALGDVPGRPGLRKDAGLEGLDPAVLQNLRDTARDGMTKQAAGHLLALAEMRGIFSQD